jgi:hypothetical protein
MTTKYRAFKKSDGSITALIYMTPNPNVPAQIVGTIVPIDYDTSKGELEAHSAKHQFFPYGTTEEQMALALLKSVGVTDEDLTHRIALAKQPA